MKIILYFALITSCLCLKVEITNWKQFKEVFNKTYVNLEDENRHYDNFLINFREINRHNKKFQAGLVSFKKEVNFFTDLDEDELRDYRNFVPPVRTLAGATMFTLNQKLNIPRSFDWSSFRIISSARDQGKCSSCWAFAIVAALEAHAKLYNQTVIELSEQSLVDCDTTNKGCNGGNRGRAFNFIKNKGVALREQYPYTGKKGTCKTGIARNFKISGYGAVAKNNEDDMLAALYTKGPLTVSVNSHGFMQYSSGVYYDVNCNATTDHAVLIVGFGVEGGIDYWLAKNSWGSTWGENGYIKLARNKNNHCGIANYVLYPIL